MSELMTGPVAADDRFAIHDLLMAYNMASDTGDPRGYAETFANDGVLITSDGERLAGRGAIEAYARKFFALPGSRGRMHFFQQMTTRREGAGVRVFSFWMVVQWSVTDDSRRVRSTGTTDDLCIRQDGRWLLGERRIGRWNSRTAPWAISPLGD